MYRGTSTPLKRVSRPGSQRSGGMCACPIGQDVPADTCASPGYAATTKRMQEIHQQDEPARRTGGKTSSTIQVWSYNCESCLVPGRMAELLYTAKCRGADAVCLQGTQMTMETPWTHGQWYVTPVARTTHRPADGVLTAVSIQRFSKESIVAHYGAAARRSESKLDREGCRSWHTPRLRISTNGSVTS